MKNPAMKSHPKATHYVLADKSASTVSGAQTAAPRQKKRHASVVFPDFPLSLPADSVLRPLDEGRSEKGTGCESRTVPLL